MFQNQHGAIENALKAAGLPASSAVAIARILSNVSAAYRVTNLETDTTPRNMRQVTPQDALTLPNLEFREADPYHRKQRTSASENRELPTQGQAIVANVAPQQTDAKNGLRDGAYTEVISEGNESAVSLRVRGVDNGVAVLDKSDNSIVSKHVRAESNANGIRFFVQSTDTEVVWKLAIDGSQAVPVDVVTDVRLGANAIEITKQKIYPVIVGPLVDAADIPVVECPPAAGDENA